MEHDNGGSEDDFPFQLGDFAVSDCNACYFPQIFGTLKIIMFDLHGAFCWPVSHNKMLHDFSEAYLDVPLEVGING